MLLRDGLGLKKMIYCYYSFVSGYLRVFATLSVASVVRAEEQ